MVSPSNGLRWGKEGTRTILFIVIPTWPIAFRMTSQKRSRFMIKLHPTTRSVGVWVLLTLAERWSCGNSFCLFQPSFCHSTARRGSLFEKADLGLGYKIGQNRIFHPCHLRTQQYFNMHGKRTTLAGIFFLCCAPPSLCGVRGRVSNTGGGRQWNFLIDTHTYTTVAAACRSIVVAVAVNYDYIIIYYKL